VLDEAVVKTYGGALCRAEGSLAVNHGAGTVLAG
jgi:hypothetical protein